MLVKEVINLIGFNTKWRLVDARTGKLLCKDTNSNKVKNRYMDNTIPDNAICSIMSKYTLSEWLYPELSIWVHNNTINEYAKEFPDNSNLTLGFFIDNCLGYTNMWVAKSYSNRIICSNRSAKVDKYRDMIITDISCEPYITNNICYSRIVLHVYTGEVI